MVVGLIFFLAVGNFVYSFGQCTATFSRLDKLINRKIFGVTFLIIYIYFVFTNQEAVVNAFIEPFK